MLRRKNKCRLVGSATVLKTDQLKCSAGKKLFGIEKLVPDLGWLESQRWSATGSADSGFSSHARRTFALEVDILIPNQSQAPSANQRCNITKSNEMVDICGGIIIAGGGKGVMFSKVKKTPKKQAT